MIGAAAVSLRLHVRDDEGADVQSEGTVLGESRKRRTKEKSEKEYRGWLRRRLVSAAANVRDRQKSKVIYFKTGKTIRLRAHGQSNNTEKISVALALKTTHYSKGKLEFLQFILSLCDGLGVRPVLCSYVDSRRYLKFTLERRWSSRVENS